MSNKDNIYATALDTIAGFAFDENVVRVFPDMIQRSVPGYSTIIAMTGVLAERYAQPQTNCYDLGCSLGASTLSMRHAIDKDSVSPRDCRIIAIDNSPAMIAHCHELIAQDSQHTPVDLQLADICDVDINNASVVVLNFTLQFVPLEQRGTLLTRIGANMKPGGVLVLSEKICFEDEHLQALNTDLHHAFKRANGYSDLEVSQKRTSLENVLIPETINTHQQRLRGAGFTSVDVWFQCFNFASLVAIR
jgi:tRNA (cmo5U34)-methyltransferase